jgi:hypothetical protein
MLSWHMFEFARWDYHVVITCDPMRKRSFNQIVLTVSFLVTCENQKVSNKEILAVKV